MPAFVQRYTFTVICACMLFACTGTMKVEQNEPGDFDSCLDSALTYAQKSFGFWETVGWYRRALRKASGPLNLAQQLRYRSGIAAFAFDNRDYATTISATGPLIVRKSVSVMGNYYGLWLITCHALKKNGDTAKAIELYEMLANTQYRTIARDASANLLGLYYQTGRVADAYKLGLALREWQADNHNDISAHIDREFIIAQCATLLNLNQEAIRSYREVLRLINLPFDPADVSEYDVRRNVVNRILTQPSLRARVLPDVAQFNRDIVEITHTDSTITMHKFGGRTVGVNQQRIPADLLVLPGDGRATVDTSDFNKFTITSSAQDANGFKWLATFNGLYFQLGPNLIPVTIPNYESQSPLKKIELGNDSVKILRFENTQTTFRIDSILHGYQPHTSAHEYLRYFDMARTPSCYVRGKKSGSYLEIRPGLVILHDSNGVELSQTKVVNTSGVPLPNRFFSAQLVDDSTIIATTNLGVWLINIKSSTTYKLKLVPNSLNQFYGADLNLVQGAIVLSASSLMSYIAGPGTKWSDTIYLRTEHLGDVLKKGLGSRATEQLSKSLKYNISDIETENVDVLTASTYRGHTRVFINDTNFVFQISSKGIVAISISSVNEQRILFTKEFQAVAAKGFVVSCLKDGEVIVDAGSIVARYSFRNAADPPANFFMAAMQVTPGGPYTLCSPNSSVNLTTHDNVVSLYVGDAGFEKPSFGSLYYEASNLDEGKHPFKDYNTILSGLLPNGNTISIGVQGSEPSVHYSIMRDAPFTEQPIVRYSALVVLVIGIALVVVSIRRRHKTDVLAELDRQRSSMSRDLHDTVGAELARLNAWMKSNSGVNPDKRTTFDPSIASLSVRGLMQAWSNDDHTFPSLSAAIAEHVRRVAQSAGLECDIDYPQDVPDVKIPNSLTRGVMLVVNEALANTVKHAAATNVVLQMNCDSNEFSVKLSDNGLGFAAAALSSKRGLQNMQIRASDSKFTCTVHSAPNQGTTVYIQIPLKWK